MPTDRAMKRLDDLHLEQFPDSELAMKIRMRRLDESARAFTRWVSASGASFKEAAEAARRLSLAFKSAHRMGSEEATDAD